jgi:hypothetical protein
VATEDFVKTQETEVLRAEAPETRALLRRNLSVKNLLAIQIQKKNAVNDQLED